MATSRPKFPGSGTIVEEAFLKGLEMGRAEVQFEARAEGRAKGRAEDILRVLAVRGVEVPGAGRRAPPPRPLSAAR